MLFIDSHVHLWNLKQNINSWVLKDNKAKYLPHHFEVSDYLKTKLDPKQIITVEAADNHYALNEAIWINNIILNLAANITLKHIGHIDMLLGHEDFILELEKYRQFTFIIGFRDILAFSHQAEYCPYFEDITLNPTKLLNLTRNLKTLKENNYIFSCQMYPDQLLRIYNIITIIKVTCIIDHCGLPILNSKFEHRRWLEMLKLYNGVATFKLSGFDINQNQYQIKRIISDLQKYIAPENIIFGSNLPITSITIIEKVKDLICDHYNIRDQHKIIYENANKLFN